MQGKASSGGVHWERQPFLEEVAGVSCACVGAQWERLTCKCLVRTVSSSNRGIEEENKVSVLDFC